MKLYILPIVAIVVTTIITFVIVQILIIRFNGSPVAVPDIPRSVQTVGSGTPLSYAIMGDSTAISQGSDYDEGFAAASITHLARTYKVKALNTGISGATTEDIRRHQLETVLRFKPDIVLLAAGANDATHFVRSDVTIESMQYIIDELKKVNPHVKIIVTGSPAMDSVSRFPRGSKQVMRLRTQQVNDAFGQLINKNDLIFAPIAEKTRDAFIADPTLTASDNFHPNARGYSLWIPIINRAIDQAIDDRETDV